MSRNKALIITARIISMIFTPFYLPLIGIALLFTFSYMNMLPLGYKLLVVTIVYLLTIFFPTFLIYLYRRFQGWSLVELGQKRRRVVAYAISIACYVACIWLMYSYHIYHFIIIVIAALLIQAVSLLINIWWKISTHTAAIGGVAGALMAFAELFRFNPVWWLCVVILLSGILGTARIILRQHSLGQVMAGFFVGTCCAFLTILYL